jgi:hypothetical protein
MLPAGEFNITVEDASGKQLQSCVARSALCRVNALQRSSLEGNGLWANPIARPASFKNPGT